MISTLRTRRVCSLRVVISEYDFTTLVSPQAVVLPRMVRINDEAGNQQFGAGVVPKPASDSTMTQHVFCRGFYKRDARWLAELYPNVMSLELLVDVDRFTKPICILLKHFSSKLKRLYLWFGTTHTQQLTEYDEYHLEYMLHYFKYVLNKMGQLKVLLVEGLPLPNLYVNIDMPILSRLHHFAILSSGEAAVWVYSLLQYASNNPRLTRISFGTYIADCATFWKFMNFPIQLRYKFDYLELNRYPARSLETFCARFQCLKALTITKEPVYSIRALLSALRQLPRLAWLNLSMLDADSHYLQDSFEFEYMGDENEFGQPLPQLPSVTVLRLKIYGQQCKTPFYQSFPNLQRLCLEAQDHYSEDDVDFPGYVHQLLAGFRRHCSRLYEVITPAQRENVV